MPLIRFLVFSLVILVLAGCQKVDGELEEVGDGEAVDGELDGVSNSSEPAESADPHTPPLYWSVYEYHIIRQQAAENGPTGDVPNPATLDNYITEAEFLANIDWVEEELKPFGYDMVAIDGWGDTEALNENGYRASHSRYWEHDYAWWSELLRSRGMKLGMYENPLFIHVPASNTTTMIVGTDIPVSSLLEESEQSSTFRWVDTEQPGAEQYIKGYISYYADMGIDHLRVDFLSWFENGFDRNLGQVGLDRPREEYETALRWMREEADQRGMYLSYAMPHLFNDAELELEYADSFRINDDVDFGKWFHFSEKNRGDRFENWSQWSNPFDGFVYWSSVSGRDRARLDGDFIRINTYASDIERRTVVSLHLMAGGPIAVADRYNTIGDNVRFYQNEEMLALNRDGFVGQPLTNDPADEDSQIWTGQMSDGDIIVGLFNRESTPSMRSVSFYDIGVTEEVTVRDLWQQAQIGGVSPISVELAPHASLILRLTPGQSTCTPQAVQLAAMDEVTYGNPAPTLEATATSELPVRFEVALGPASVDGDQVVPLGQSGTVYVVASQPGNDTWCAAIPVVRSFEVTGGHQQQMYIAATFTDWAPSIEMALQDDVWVAEDVQIPAGEHEFKFASSPDWSGQDWGNWQGFGGAVMATTGGGPNVFIIVPEAGTYTVRFNDLTLEYSFERVTPSA